MDWWRISLKWLERGSELSIITCDLGGQLHGFVGSGVPPDGVPDEREQVVGVDALGLGQEARLREQLVQGGGVVLDDRPLAGELKLDRLGAQALEQPEVQERHAPVVEQQEVAGVRVAGELAVAVQAAEEEAKDDLADAVALGLRAVLELLEADAADELAHQHPLARETADHVGDDDERMPGEDTRERALVLGLQLVVELLDDPLLDLLRDRLDVERGSHPLEQAHDHVKVLQVGAHRAGDAGVLHLDCHLAAVVERGFVDLADRGGGDRLLLEGLEDVLDRFFQVLLDHPAHLLEGDRGCGVAQLGQLVLELFAVLLGDQPDVQEGHHLPELHGGALHRAEHGDDLLGGLQLAPGQSLLGGLLATRHVGGARAELLNGLAGSEGGNSGRAPRA